MKFASRYISKYLQDQADLSGSDSGDESSNDSQQSDISNLIDSQSIDDNVGPSFYNLVANKKRRIDDDESNDSVTIQNTPPINSIDTANTQDDVSVLQTEINVSDNVSTTSTQVAQTPVVDMKRIGTFSYVEFINDDNGNPVYFHDINAITSEQKDKYGKFTPQLLRVLNHPDSSVCWVKGQMELCPTTGRLHFQACLKLYSKIKGKSTREVKYTAPILAAKMRKFMEDDDIMKQHDNLTLVGTGSKWPFDLQAGREHPAKLTAYCTKEFYEEDHAKYPGQRKRAFGDILSWDLFKGQLTDEARNGSSMDQMAALATAGEDPLNILSRYGGQALMHLKKINEVVETVNQRKEKQSSLRRCGNVLCGIQFTTREDAEYMAKHMNISYNEIIQKLNTTCKSQAMYCYGDAGTGKSSFTYNVACMEHGTENVFIKPTGDYWGSSSGCGGCGYTNEEALVIHDLGASHFPASHSGKAQGMNEFKRIVDCTKADVQTKGGTRPLKAKAFYFDSNENPVDFFVSLCGDIDYDKMKIEYEAFCRRIKVVYHYKKSADNHVTQTGEQMPTWTSVLSTLHSRRQWMIAKNGPCPPFRMEEATAPIVMETHGTLKARANLAIFNKRMGL